MSNIKRLESIFSYLAKLAVPLQYPSDDLQDPADCSRLLSYTGIPPNVYFTQCTGATGVGMVATRVRASHLLFATKAGNAVFTHVTKMVVNASPYTPTPPARVTELTVTVDEKLKMLIDIPAALLEKVTEGTFAYFTGDRAGMIAPLHQRVDLYSKLLSEEFVYSGVDNGLAIPQVSQKAEDFIMAKPFERLGNGGFMSAPFVFNNSWAGQQPLPGYNPLQHPWPNGGFPNHVSSQNPWPPTPGFMKLLKEQQERVAYLEKVVESLSRTISAKQNDEGDITGDEKDESNTKSGQNPPIPPSSHQPGV